MVMVVVASADLNLANVLINSNDDALRLAQISRFRRTTSGFTLSKRATVRVESERHRSSSENIACILSSNSKSPSSSIFCLCSSSRSVY